MTAVARAGNCQQSLPVVERPELLCVAGLVIDAMRIAGVMHGA